MTTKSLLSAFLIATILSGLFLVEIMHLGTVQASTDVNGILRSDTTWTKTNSPYTFTGPVAVNNGVTLTIETGVTVNLGAYYLQVNGTLHARGSGTDNIIFSSQATSDLSQIVFTQLSTSWNEQIGSGSIIENAIINASISLTGVSPRINNNIIRDITASMMDSNVAISINGGSPIISNNQVMGGVSVGGEGSAVISNNTITGGMGIYGGSHVISNNEISGGSSYFYIGRDFDRDYDVIAIGGGSPVLSGNKITGNSLGIGFYENAQASAIIFNNKIYGCGAGIAVKGGNLTSLTIQGNLLMNNGYGIDASTNVLQPIEGNLIFNNTNGIRISSNVQLTIRNNTFANNSVAISTNSLLATIIYNNIQNSGQYSIYLPAGTSNDINATYNWWGTTDTQLISQSIFDNKNDFNLGNVVFIPILTSPNPEAPAMTMTIPDPALTAYPSPTPSPNPSPSPSTNSTSSSDGSQTQSDESKNQTTPQAEFDIVEIAILIVLIVIAALLGANLVLRKRHMKNTNPAAQKQAQT